LPSISVKERTYNAIEESFQKNLLKCAKPITKVQAYFLETALDGSCD